MDKKGFVDFYVWLYRLLFNNLMCVIMNNRYISFILCFVYRLWVISFGRWFGDIVFCSWWFFFLVSFDYIKWCFLVVIIISIIELECLLFGYWVLWVGFVKWGLFEVCICLLLFCYYVYLGNDFRVFLFFWIGFLVIVGI